MSRHDNRKGFHRVSVIFTKADIGCRDSQEDCHRVSRYSGGYRGSQYDCHRVIRDSGGLSRGGGNAAIRRALQVGSGRLP